jgi:ribonucleoside-diphosphate reductase subunit M2
MTVFDAQSELAAKNLRSTVLTRLAEMKIDLNPGEEVLLKENTRRFCLFPIKFHEVRIYCIKEKRV